MPPSKSAEAFRTISEAATELDVPQHVLRHWEEVFGQIRPMRRAGGRRYYRPIDIDVLRGVRVLLYDERYTTKGVQQIFKEKGVKYIAELGRISAAGQSVDLRPPLSADDGADQPDPKNERTNGRAGVQPGSGDIELPPALRERLSKLASRLERVQNSLDEAALAIDAIDLDKSA